MARWALLILAAMVVSAVFWWAALPTRPSDELFAKEIAAAQAEYLEEADQRRAAMDRRRRAAGLDADWDCAEALTEWLDPARESLPDLATAFLENRGRLATEPSAAEALSGAMGPSMGIAPAQDLRATLLAYARTDPFLAQFSEWAALGLCAAALDPVRGVSLAEWDGLDRVQGVAGLLAVRAVAWAEAGYAAEAFQGLFAVYELAAGLAEEPIFAAQEHALAIQAMADEALGLVLHAAPPPKAERDKLARRMEARASADPLIRTLHAEASFALRHYPLEQLGHALGEMFAYDIYTFATHAMPVLRQQPWEARPALEALRDTSSSTAVETRGMLNTISELHAAHAARELIGRLTPIILAIEAHRHETGGYPDRLDDLEGPRAALPEDPITGGSLRYLRTPSGYVIRAEAPPGAAIEQPVRWRGGLASGDAPWTDSSAVDEEAPAPAT